VSLGTPERGEADFGESLLHIANVVVSQFDVVDQVRSRAAMSRMDGGDLGDATGLGVQ